MALSAGFGIGSACFHNQGPLFRVVFGTLLILFFLLISVLVGIVLVIFHVMIGSAAL